MRTPSIGVHPLRRAASLAVWRRAARGATVTVLLGLTVPSAALAHGGIEVAKGGGDGARIAVHGSDAGPGEVDFATTLTGPGSGEGSRVTYWVRPEGRKRSFRVATQRDESGIHHAEIPVEGRGSWQDWDVSAYVTLSSGKRLRVTTDRANPPAAPERRAATATREAVPPAGATTGQATPTQADVADADEPVDDVPGEGDGMPSWGIPSLVALVLVALVAVVVRNRRLPPDEDD